MTTPLECDFHPRDRVYIDGCQNLIAVVTAAIWRDEGMYYEVSWFMNGDAKVTNVEGWRLSPVDE